MAGRKHAWDIICKEAHGQTKLSLVVGIMSMTSKRAKVGYLDGLRGVACLVVVTDHWFLMGYDDTTSHSTSVLWESWLLRSPLRIFVDGGFAVAIFLDLSGYWTLQIELLGSWIIYLIALGFVLFDPIWRKVAAYAFALLIIPVLFLIGGYGVAPLPLQYLQSFLVGMFIADLQASGHITKLIALRHAEATR
eukprot:gene32559-40174_t